MLEMAQIKPGDVVYDLGCGDGRILVAAAKKYGVRAVGFDIDPVCVRESRSNAVANGVAHLVTVHETDIFKVDLSPASVVTMYLLPELNVRLMPQLEKLKPGSRIVSHDFDMRGARPSEVHRMSALTELPKRTLDQSQSGAPGLPPLPRPDRRTHTIYKWIVPWTKDAGASTVAPGAPPAR
jgi:tRNA G37 N-methylase Trm5